MRFKLDENFGSRTQHLFREAGHDIHTVRDEGLQGCADEQLFAICAREGLCLVTLDLDFSDVTRFAPATSQGVVVIRPPRNPSLSLLEALVRQFLEALRRQSFQKELWIVEPGRIRIHQSE
jgi:predicted nuclease of predicted toxin-antitoxin system